jgi:hypothetical protein
MLVREIMVERNFTRTRAIYLKREKSGEQRPTPSALRRQEHREN